VDYRDAEGRRRRPLFGSEEAAHEHATDVLRSEGLLAVPAEDREVTLRAYATRWVTMIQHEKEANTVRNYKERLDGHVLPAPGHLKVRELHRGQIKVFLAEKRGRGYAKNTVRLMRATLSSMLSDAVDDGIIMTNPALDLGRRKASRADRPIGGPSRTRTLDPLIKSGAPEPDTSMHSQIRARDSGGAV